MPSWLSVVMAVAVYVYLFGFDNPLVVIRRSINVRKMRWEERRVIQKFQREEEQAIRKQAEGYMQRLRNAAQFVLDITKNGFELTQSKERYGAITLWVIDPKSVSHSPVLVATISLREDPKLWISLSETQRWTRVVIDEMTLREAVALIEITIRDYSLTLSQGVRQAGISGQLAHYR